MEVAGIIYRHSPGIDLFLDGEGSSAREGVHIIFAGELVRPTEPAANPDVTESTSGTDFRVLTLEALVRVKLTAFGRKDQVHLLDMIELGMLDRTWFDRLPPVLAERLRELIENPE